MGIFPSFGRGLRGDGVAFNVPSLNVSPTSEGRSASVSVRAVRPGRWVLDDGLLRDEGIYFGLSKSEEAVRERLRAIEAYHNVILEQAQAQAKAQKARLDRLVAAREQHVHEVERLRCEQSDAQVPTLPLRRLLHWLVSSVLAAFALVGAYLIARDALSEVFVWPGAVALAVVGGGGLALHPVVTGRWVDPGEGLFRSAVRAALLLVPAVAAFFSVAGLFGVRPLPVVVSALLMQTVTLYLGGLLFLRGVAGTGTAWALLRTVRRQSTSRRYRLAELERCIEQLDEKIDEALERLDSTPSDAEVKALCDYKKALFHSEMLLAQGALGQDIGLDLGESET